MTEVLCGVFVALVLTALYCCELRFIRINEGWSLLSLNLPHVC